MMAHRVESRFDRTFCGWGKRRSDQMPTGVYAVLRMKRRDKTGSTSSGTPEAVGVQTRQQQGAVLFRLLGADIVNRSYPRTHPDPADLVVNSAIH